MPDNPQGVSRRRFLGTTIAAAGATAIPLDRVAQALDRVAPAQAPRWTRYNVMSAGGQRALASYARGVAAMLALPATHPQNWFRNAFIHLMDCPHGNWWFYVWHRGYLGYFEQTIRNLSGDPGFAIPYWDWTTLPRIPQGMFDGVLSPAAPAFAAYTRNLGVFTAQLRPALEQYFNGLAPAQRAQLNARGYTDFGKMWNDVTGLDPVSGNGITGNVAWANPCGARYLTADNPDLDKKTTYDVSPFIIRSGLRPTQFWSPQGALSFSSSRTPSHNTAPGSATVFSVLEGFPHNKVHNYIGGVGPVDPGPYGNMTNFLSPVDPVFFLHHANMDRLWDVWTRKQISIGQPILPQGADLAALSQEPFLFYVDGNGRPVGTSRAGDYYGMQRWGYVYEPGFAEELVQPTKALVARSQAPAVAATVRSNTATATIAGDLVRAHLASDSDTTLLAEVTLPRPGASSPTREFDVLVGAPANVESVEADSPFFAGTIAFFGHMAHAEHADGNATFLVPLPKRPEAFTGVASLQQVAVSIRVVPANRQRSTAPMLRRVVVRAL